MAVEVGDDDAALVHEQPSRLGQRRGKPLVLNNGIDIVRPNTEPEAEQEMLLEKLGLSLPAQPPPRIRAGQLTEPTDDGAPPAGDPAVL